MKIFIINNKLGNTKFVKLVLNHAIALKIKQKQNEISKAATALSKCIKLG